MLNIIYAKTVRYTSYKNGVEQLIYCKHAHTHTEVEEPGQGGEMGKAGRQDSRPLKKDTEESGM